MTIPDWYEAILLALAAWRTYHLLAYDDIMDRPRRYVTRLPRGWEEGDRLPDNYRTGVAEFVNCPFCFGFWIAIAWWGAFQLWEHDTVVAAVPLALSAGVVAAQALLSSE